MRKWIKRIELDFIGLVIPKMNCTLIKDSNVMRWLFHTPCLVLFFLFTGTAWSSETIILQNLNEMESNEIMVFLNSWGIDASKTRSRDLGPWDITWDISVKENRATEAIAILSQKGLPHSGEKTLAEQMASTIQKIDGILDSDVQLSFPNDSLNANAEKKGKVIASVYIKHSGTLDDQNLHLSKKIKRLVAASVPGLDYNDVTIIAEKVVIQ